MTSTIRIEVARLVSNQRWAALATLDDGAPRASMVSYAAEPELSGLLMFLSSLSRHTRNLLDHPYASLAVTEPDTGVPDPQTLARTTLSGPVRPIDRQSADFARAWHCYVARFPAAAPRLGLADFVLFRLSPEEVRHVGGFARAFSLTGDELRDAAHGLSRGDG